jgi:hypothetical protein
MMIRTGIGVVAAVLMAGCGQAGTSTPQGHPKSYPHAAPSTRPPAATLTSATGTRRLVTGSYCWTARTGKKTFATGCGDAASPELMPGMPRVHVHHGETLVVHLGFTPTAPVEATLGDRHYRLPAASVLHLRVRSGGFLMIDPRRGHDDVEYLARIVMSS